MELKLSFLFYRFYSDGSSNRTFMELKFGSFESVQIKLYRSNRTFMELKFVNLHLSICAQVVLIVPLWN